MPFQSKAQQAFMHARHPQIAKKWDKMTDFSHLPEKKKEKADGSASDSALFKEDMPKHLKLGKSVETAVHEDDTLMGRLAKRMASRDYIAKQNLGMGTEAQKAATADMKDDEVFSNMPMKMNFKSQVKKEANEHPSFNQKQVKQIVKDHEKKDRPISNMADQAKAAGNVYDSRND